MGTATVRYTITNQSNKPHTLVMTPITGITQQTTFMGSCANPFVLAPQQSCVLTLKITGSALPSTGITSGPRVCEQGSSLQCYQPSHANSLLIKTSSTPDKAVLSVSPATLAFTEEGSAQTVTLSNDSNISAHDVLTTLSPDIGVTVNASTCGSTLAEQSQCMISFLPGTTSGPTTATITGGNVASPVTVGITVSPLVITATPSSLSFEVNQTGAISVTNTSSTYSAMGLSATSPAGVIPTSASPPACTSTLAPNTSCNMAFTSSTVGSPGDITISGTNTNSLTVPVTVTQVSTTTLSIDPALTLKMNGEPRTVRVTNTGSAPAFGVSSSTSITALHLSALTSDCLPSLAAGASCTFTLTPSTSSSTAAAGATAAPVNLNVSGTNTGAQVSSGIIVLTYGNIYQGGYVYAIDDTTPNSGSVGGKVLSLQDQKSTSPDGIAWDADPACAALPFLCTTQTNANDFYNGASNTSLISSVLNGHDGNINNTPSTYAAGVCISYNGSSYTDWYLPAICEMGPANGGSGCVVGTQNIVSNLPGLLGTTSHDCSFAANCLARSYWSSTEYFGPPWSRAWDEYFVPAGGSLQFSDPKDRQFGVRCSRALTF